MKAGAKDRLFFAMQILFIFAELSVFSQSGFVNRGYEKGELKNGYKTGVWQYYDSTGVLELEVDYSTGKLLQLERDTSKYLIYKDGQWVWSELDIHPRYIGSSVEFYNILSENVDYTVQAWYRDIVGTEWVLFEVDTNGKAINFEKINEIGGECGDEFLRVVKLIPNYWLVAQKDGKKYRSRFIISCRFGIIMDGKQIKERKRRKKILSDSIELPAAKILPGISYTIKKGYNPD
jgi:hypothetical protein